MIRKPEPKEAAKAVIAMFAKKGIIVPRSLALEMVAVVEGYNNWNTMSAAIPTVTAAKPAKASNTVRFPEIDDDDGPFEVTLDGLHYTTLERFDRADDLTEMFAAELDAEYIAEIRDASGRCRAKYVGDHTRHRVYYQETTDMSVDLAKRVAEDKLELDVEASLTCFGHPENFYDNIVEIAASGVGDENMTFILGYRVYDTNPTTGRVAHPDLHTPVRLGVLVVHGELRFVSPDFPVDVRERIAASVK